MESHSRRRFLPVRTSSRPMNLSRPVGRVQVPARTNSCSPRFPITQHGGFGAPHVTGVITLLTLVLAWQAGRGKWFGRVTRYVEVVSYSATFLFHMIPALVETSTRLPAGKPLISDRNGPEIQAATGILFPVVLDRSSVAGPPPAYSAEGTNELSRIGGGHYRTELILNKATIPKRHSYQTNKALAGG
jgi:hypothetical protein